MRCKAVEVAPAARMLRHGARVLSDAELIGVLLSGAGAKGGTPGVARDLLRERGGVAGLVATTPAQLRMCGLEDAHASNLLAACELACRLAAGNVPERKPLSRPNDVVRYLHLRYGKDDQEVLGALYLNRRHRLVAEVEIFRGTLDRAAVEPRLRPLHSNPCPRIGRYRENKRERFLTGAELRRLGEALSAVEQDGSEDPAAVLAIRLLLLTGARRDEILNLRWQDVDLDTGTLNLPDSKTGKKSIPLGPAAVEVLAAAPRLEGGVYVIPGRRQEGRFVGIHRPWARIRERAGLEDVRLHDARHSFASVGVAANLGLPVIGAILGHRHPATTARYAHLDDDPRRAAAARISSQIAADLSGRPAAEVIPFKKS